MNLWLLYENTLTEYINISKAGIMDGSSIALPEWKSSNICSPNSFNNSCLSQVLNDSTVFLFIKWPRAIYLEFVSLFISLRHQIVFMIVTTAINTNFYKFNVKKAYWLKDEQSNEIYGQLFES